jgi:hypothetical protein
LWRSFCRMRFVVLNIITIIKQINFIICNRAYRIRLRFLWWLFVPIIPKCSYVIFK